jgi:hypothetical protein
VIASKLLKSSSKKIKITCDPILKLFLARIKNELQLKEKNNSRILRIDTLVIDDRAYYLKHLQVDNLKITDRLYDYFDERLSNKHNLGYRAMNYHGNYLLELTINRLDLDNCKSHNLRQLKRLRIGRLFGEFFKKTRN